MDPDEVVHDEPPHLDLHFLPSFLGVLNSLGVTGLVLVLFLQKLFCSRTF